MAEWWMLTGNISLQCHIPTAAGLFPIPLNAAFYPLSSAETLLRCFLISFLYHISFYLPLTIAMSVIYLLYTGARRL